MPNTVISKTEALAILNAGVAEIVFTKADKTTRTMVGTLQEARLPSKAQQSTFDDNLIVVWDMVKNDWRSVRLDRVLTFKKGTDALATRQLG